MSHWYSTSTADSRAGQRRVESELVETPTVVSKPAVVPRVIDERTTATKSGPGNSRAGMNTAKTGIRKPIASMVYSAACFKSFDGRHRRIGLRAASVSSRRRRGAKRGAAWKSSPAVPLLARSASERKAAMKRSRSSLAWLSGRLDQHGAVTSGKYMVMG